MWTYYGIDLIATLIIAVSIWGIGGKKRWALLLGVLGCVGWMIFGYMSNSLFVILGNLGFGLLNLRAWCKWGKPKVWPPGHVYHVPEKTEKEVCDNWTHETDMKKLYLGVLVDTDIVCGECCQTVLHKRVPEHRNPQDYGPSKIKLPGMPH